MWSHYGSLTYKINQPNPQSKTVYMHFRHILYVNLMPNCHRFMHSVCVTMVLYNKIVFYVGCRLLRTPPPSNYKSKTLRDGDNSCPGRPNYWFVHHPVILYLCYFIHPRTAMVIKPVKETLVNSTWIPPWFSVPCQGLSMMPNNWIWERNWGSWGESNTMMISIQNIW